MDRARIWRLLLAVMVGFWLALAFRHLLEGDITGFVIYFVTSLIWVFLLMFAKFGVKKSKKKKVKGK